MGSRPSRERTTPRAPVRDGNPLRTSLLRCSLIYSISPSADETGPSLSTPTPEPAQEQALRDVPFAQVVQGSFGAQGLTEEETALEASDGSSYSLLGRLIGHLYWPDSMTMAVFIDHRPSGTGGPPKGVSA